MIGATVSHVKIVEKLGDRAIGPVSQLSKPHDRAKNLTFLHS
jgi:hypothetical protein